MSNIKKFEYTTGDLFSLTGSPYVGYFNVIDGAAYTGKYEQITLLNNQDNARNVFALSNKFYNRTPNEVLTLTYGLSDFIFGSNEYINNNSINLKLEKAYSNFLDCFKSCFMASSQLPYNFTRTAVLSNTNTSTRFVWTTGTNSNTYVMSPSSILNNVSNIALFKNTYTTNNTLVISNSAALFTYKINPTGGTFSLAFSSNRVDTTNMEGYGDVHFSNITDMAKNNNYLFVADVGNRKVYKYDVKSVLDEDRALGYKFNLIQTVDQTQVGFYQPQLIEASAELIFVYDSSNYIVYIYNDTFTLVNSYKNSKLFSKSQPVSLTYYRLYQELYILTSDFKIVILDKDANSRIIQLDTDIIVSNEIAKKLIFSNSYSDVFYLLTNASLYKFFISNFKNIGEYSFSNNLTSYNMNVNGSVLFDVDTYESNANYDNIILYGYDQLINYNEQTLFYSLIK